MGEEGKKRTERKWPAERGEIGRTKRTRERRAGLASLRFGVSAGVERKLATGTVNFARAGEHVAIQD